MSARVLKLAIVVALAASAESSRWLEVPYVRQEKEGCGSAAISMVMQYWIRAGAAVKSEAADPARIQTLLHDSVAKGIYASAMGAYLKQNDFSVYVISGDRSDLERHVSQGRPLILCLNGNSSGSMLHYVVVVGIDAARNRIIVHDPIRGAYRAEKEKEFFAAWRGSNNWTLLAVPASPAL